MQSTNTLWWMTEYPELGLAGMYRIIKKSGGERISEDAADQLRMILETIATKISDQAVALATHAGRKTIKAEDIQLAEKNLLNLIH